MDLLLCFLLLMNEVNSWAYKWNQRCPIVDLFLFGTVICSSYKYLNSYCLPFRLVRSKRLLDQSCQMLLQDCSSDMLVIGRQDFFSFSFLKKLLPYFPTWWCLQPHAFMCACSSVYLLYLIHMRNLLRFGLLIDYHMLWYAFTCYFVCLLYNIFILSILWLMHVRDKVVDFHWNTSDPWTIVSVSDDCGSTGGGGTLQVMDFFF